MSSSRLERLLRECGILQEDQDLIDDDDDVMPSTQDRNSTSKNEGDNLIEPKSDIMQLNYETGQFESSSNTTDKRRRLNPGTGNFETDSEDSMIPTNNNVHTSKKIKLNCTTGEFETDSDSNVSEDGNEENKVKKGKKRVRRPETWEKNIAVKKRIRDHEKKDIQDCRCKCRSKLTENDINNIFNKFINLESHTQQNIYLQGCLKEQIPNRFRPRKQRNTARNRRVFKYLLTVKNKSIEVCQQAFLAVHGIKRDRLQAKIQHAEKNIIDGRGRNPSKVKYTEETIQKIHKFIESVPARTSHYCRSTSKHKKYLDSRLSIAMLHREFLKRNSDLNCDVTYEKFREIFNTDFDYSFGTPRKDLCRTCEKFAVDIHSAELEKDRQKVKYLKAAQETHLRKAEVFLKGYSKSEKEVPKNESKMSICFDYQKNLPLPVTNVSDEYYLRQLWLHIFGIHNLQENSATMYMYTENYAKKGPNEVITALNNYIENNKSKKQKELEIFCDNCFSQNKNRYIFTYLDQLCGRGVFERITVLYPIPGHSMMPIDRDFALIERLKLKHEKIYTPETYVRFVKESRINKKFEVVFLEANLGAPDDSNPVIKVKDYKSLHEERIKPTIPGISSCRRVIFKTHSNPEMSDLMTGDNFKPIRLYRVGFPRITRSEPADCFNTMIKVKEAKVNDVKQLVQFIPVNERAFYNNLFEQLDLLARVEEDANDSSDEIE